MKPPRRPTMFAEPSRNRPRESANYPNVTNGRDEAGLSKDASTAIRGGAPARLLRARAVIALTETTAAIQGAIAVLTYRKLNKPALGSLGDSLDDMGAAT